MANWFNPDSWLYRKRYILGYLMIVVAFTYLLYLAGTYVPGGLSTAEQTAFVRAASIDLQNINSLTITSLPFYTAQRGIIELLGPSVFSIKLLSLILSLVTGIGAVLLLRRWFKPNIALLAAVIMITTGQFLYVAQLGTPSITYVMWSVWLLLTATMITTSERHKRLWKILFFILVPLSLYTPLSIYLVLAIISAGLIHPHVRHVVRRMSKPHLILLILMSIALTLPLLYLVVRDPSMIPGLLGLPATWPPSLIENGRMLLQQYFNFINPQSGTLMTPVLGLGSIALIGLGFWRLFKIRYTARSYTLVAWLILLIPVLLINPIFTTITFTPLLIILAMGLEFLLRSWYKLFPRNPYARFVGLVPLVILVGGLVISGLNRYFYGYRHDPATASNFSRDLSLFERKVKSSDPLTLVVDKSEIAFYTAIANLESKSNAKLTVTTNVPLAPQTALAATHAAHAIVQLPIERIVTTATSGDADRFYIYKTK